MLQEQAPGSVDSELLRPVRPKRCGRTKPPTASEHLIERLGDPHWCLLNSLARAGLVLRFPVGGWNCDNGVISSFFISSFRSTRRLAISYQCCVLLA